MYTKYLYDELYRLRDLKDANENSISLEIDLKCLVKKVLLSFHQMWESSGSKNPYEFIRSNEFVDYIGLYKGFLEFPEILYDHLDNIKCLTNQMNVAKEKVDGVEFDECSKECCQFASGACLILKSID